MEFVHANIKLDVLVNYNFITTRVGSVCVGDIVTLAYTQIRGGNPFFAVITETASELHSGFVKLHLDMIDSKIHPLSV